MRRACSAALLLCAALALAHARGYKRAEMSASPFVLSSRYGRSSPRMSPRNDRFFLTGRYGKRAARLPLGAPARGLPSDRDAARAACASDRDGARAACAADRDRARAARTSDRDARSWRLYAGARARAHYYKRVPELVDSSFEGR